MEIPSSVFRSRWLTRVAAGLLGCLWIAAGMLVAGEAAAQLPVPTDCQSDSGGANDEPGQKDLTLFCAEPGDGSPYDLHTLWNWDETTIQGANTNDACSLYDTDSDGNANLAVCITNRNGGGAANLGAVRLFTCNDSRPDRCAGPTQLEVNNCVGGADNGQACSIESDCASTMPGEGICVPTSGDKCENGDNDGDLCTSNADCTGGGTCTRTDTANTQCEVDQKATDPFDNTAPNGPGDDFPNDTEGLCWVDLDDLGVGPARLIDACSYPSESVNSDPSDCILFQGCTSDTDCDDENACTTDTCHTTNGSCVFTPNTGDPCEDDGDLCTTGSCNAVGFCEDGTPKDCSAAGDDCNDGVCNPGTGVCEPQPVADSTPCEDGDVCTSETGAPGTADHCEAGTCVGVQVDCDDDNECTDDSCVEPTGCVNDPNTDPCDDGNPCTTQDTCDGGVCRGGLPPPGVPECEVNFFDQHFKCYKFRPRDPFPRREVDLFDQFGSTRTTVLKPDRFCNPADKDDEGTMRNPEAHLSCYKIRDDVRVLKRDVKVTNQFGEHILSIKRADLLCNPAIKDGIGDLDAVEGETNHYKCYKARMARGQPRFLKFDVKLDDQFEDGSTATVIKPLALCNPVDKNGEGMRDPNKHLVCYKIRDAFNPRQVTFEDQFVQDLGGTNRTGDCRKSRLVCLPSAKEELSPSRAFIEMTPGLLE